MSDELMPEIEIIRSQADLDEARRTLLAWVKTDEDGGIEAMLGRLRNHQVRLDASLGLAFEAMQEASDVLRRAVMVGKIYFEIAADAIGEEAVRAKRDAKIAALLADQGGSGGSPRRSP